MNNDASLSPEVMEYLYAMSEMEPEKQDLMRKRMMVQQLRDQSQMPEGQLGDPKRGFRPARSPLEYLAPVIGQGLAAYKERGLDEQQRGLTERRRALGGSLRDRFRKIGQPAEFPQRPMPGEDTQGPY